MQRPVRAAQTPSPLVSYLVLVSPLLVLSLIFGRPAKAPAERVAHRTVDLAPRLLATELVSDRRGCAVVALADDGRLHALAAEQGELRDQVLRVPCQGEPTDWRVQVADRDHDGLAELAVFVAPDGVDAAGEAGRCLPCALYRRARTGWQLADTSPRQPFRPAPVSPSWVSLGGRTYEDRMQSGRQPADSRTDLLDPATHRRAFVLDGVLSVITDMDRDGQPELLTAQGLPDQRYNYEYRLLSYHRRQFVCLWRGRFVDGHCGPVGAARVLGAGNLLGTGNADIVAVEPAPGRLHLLSLQAAEPRA